MDNGAYFFGPCSLQKGRSNRCMTLDSVRGFTFAAPMQCLACLVPWTDPNLTNIIGFCSLSHPSKSAPG